MRYVATLRVDGVEKTEVSGVILISLVGVEEPLTSKLELPEQLIFSKINEDDVIKLVLSSDPLSPSDLEQYGSPIIILNGTLFKKSREGNEVKYWISFHGLQFRLNSRDDFLADVSNIWIGLAK